MKVYISAAKKTFKIGDYVEIIGDSIHSGDWGIIKYINEEDDEYFVGMFGADNMLPVFSRNELEKMKYIPEGV